MKLAEYRRKYPAESRGKSDAALAKHVYLTYYEGKLSREEFNKRFGFDPNSDKRVAKMAEQDVSGWSVGAMDPIYGGSQLMYNMMPESWQEGGNRFNNLAVRGMERMYGWSPFDEIPETAGVNAQVAEREKAYQQIRAREGDTGMDWDRLGGNIVSPVNLAATARLAQAAPRLMQAGGWTKAGVNAGLGGATAASMPITEQSGEYWTDKAMGTTAGAVGGWAVPAAISTAGRALYPHVKPAVDLLRQHGISMTPGRALGGVAQDVESKATSIPLLGDRIRATSNRSIDDFNRATVARVFSDSGLPMTVPDSVPTGRPLINWLDRTLDNAYDALKPVMFGVKDQQLRQDLVNFRRMIAGADSLTKKAKKDINLLIDRYFGELWPNNGAQGMRIAGETVKIIQTNLRARRDRAQQSADEQIRAVGRAASALDDMFTQMLRRVNRPEVSAQHAKLDHAWRLYTIVRDAASRAGTGRREGHFTPANLEAAIRSSRQTSKSMIARGAAPMQDLAEAGAQVLPFSYADSGTTGRLLQDVAALGGLAYGAANYPLTTAATGTALLASMIPYSTRGATDAFTRMFTSRPGMLQPVSEALKKYAALTAPMTGLLAPQTE